MRYKDHSAKIMSKLDSDLKTRLWAAGQVIATNAKMMLKMKKAVDTGNLRDSIFPTQPSKKNIRVGTNVEYAIYVEKGTRYMPARSFLVAGLERSKKDIIKVLANG